MDFSQFQVNTRLLITEDSYYRSKENILEVKIIEFSPTRNHVKIVYLPNILQFKWIESNQKYMDLVEDLGVDVSDYEKDLHNLKKENNIFDNQKYQFLNLQFPGSTINPDFTKQNIPTTGSPSDPSPLTIS